MNNIETLAENIATDLGEGLPKDLVVSYWTAKLNNIAPQQRRPRAVANSGNSIEQTVEKIRKAGDSRLMTLFAKAGKSYSYNSIAEAIYGEGEGPARGFTVKKWVQGTSNPTRRSIEKIRAFLTGLARGYYDDTLDAPGGNRKS